MVKFCPHCGKGVVFTQPAQEAQAKAAQEEAQAKAAQEEANAKAAQEEANAKAAQEEANAKAAQAKAAQESAQAKAALEEAQAKADQEKQAPPAEPEKPVNLHIAPKRSSLALKSALVLVAAAAVGALAIFMFTGKPDECELYLQRADSLLAAGNLADAKTASTSAMSTCTDEAAKRRAALIEANVDRALAAQATCERTLQSAQRLLAERRLQSARTAVVQVREVCPGHAELGRLGHEIDAMLADATGLSRSVRSSIGEGNLRQAESTLESLTRTDQEFPAIPELRSLLQSAISQAQDQIPVLPPQPLPMQQATPVPVPAQPRAQPPVPVAPAAPAAPVAPPPPAAPAPANQELVRSFLRDARQAMNQGQYDAALATARNALLIDSGNAEAQALVQQIRARQLEHTRRETRIE